MADTDPDALKELVDGLAHEQVKEKAHYLWGCAGNKPGSDDGTPVHPKAALLHPNIPDLSQDKLVVPRSPGVTFAILNTAWQSGDGYVCTGRWGLVKGDHPRAARVTDKQALQFTPKSITQAVFQELKEHTPDAEFQYRWPRPNSTRTASDNAVWGESCVGRRHFDCIGLINWLMVKGLKKSAKENLSIAAFVESGEYKKVKLKDAVMGDIVTIGDSHIGIVTRDRSVIEACDPDHGVIKSALTPRWDACWRLPPRWWHIGA